MGIPGLTGETVWSAGVGRTAGNATEDFHRTCQGPGSSQPRQHQWQMQKQLICLRICAGDDALHMQCDQQMCKFFCF